MTKLKIYSYPGGTHNGGSPRTKELCERVKCYRFRTKNNVVPYKLFKRFESDKVVKLKFTVHQCRRIVY